MIIRNAVTEDAESLLGILREELLMTIAVKSGARVKRKRLWQSLMGYTKVGEFHKCGYKFGRLYNMIWMEKIIGEKQ